MVRKVVSLCFVVALEGETKLYSEGSGGFWSEAEAQVSYLFSVGVLIQLPLSSFFVGFSECKFWGLICCFP